MHLFQVRLVKDEWSVAWYDPRQDVTYLPIAKKNKKNNNKNKQQKTKTNKKKQKKTNVNF